MNFKELNDDDYFQFGEVLYRKINDLRLISDNMYNSVILSGAVGELVFFIEETIVIKTTIEEYRTSHMGETVLYPGYLG